MLEEEPNVIAVSAGGSSCLAVPSVASVFAVDAAFMKVAAEIRILRVPVSLALKN